MSRISGPPGSPEVSTATLTTALARAKPIGAIVKPVSSRSSPNAFRLTTGKCVVGSGAKSDLIIADPTVSRTHVELELVPEGVSVTDLGSHNGTFYLGQRIERMVLTLGGRITIGGTEISIEADTEALQNGLTFVGDNFRGMLGTSVSMRRVFATLARLEGSLVTVLVTGESGCGKELIAHAIHDGSRVAEGPLVVLNCGAFPRELVASELFGHKKGAFTGAVEARRGAFETADGGTLFLDEIGELPIEVQPMLLRALESGEVRPVGGDKPKAVRVRVVAATNRNLEDEVAANRFRRDLFYRLAVVQIKIPPLRERPEDIELLARQFARSVGLNELPASVIASLIGRPWLGNVRELRNVIQAYAALGTLPQGELPEGGMLEMALSQRIDVTRPYAEQKDQLADLFTRIYLRALITHTGGNQSQAARIAELDRTYLGKLLVKHGLSRG